MTATSCWPRSLRLHPINPGTCQEQPLSAPKKRTLSYPSIYFIRADRLAQKTLNLLGISIPGQVAPNPAFGVELLGRVSSVPGVGALGLQRFGVYVY